MLTPLNKTHILLTSCLLLALVSCGASQKAPTAEDKEKKAAAEAPKPTLKPDRRADDVGRFIGGLPGRDGSEFKSLEADPAWIEHAKSIEADWKKLEETRVNAMRGFAKKELVGKPFDGMPLFYPFGGPDALTMGVLFPNHPSYTLLALEPVGTVPTTKELTRKSLDTQLPLIRKSFGALVRKGYFITDYMDHEYRGQVLTGLLPAILTLICRTEHTVLGFRYVRVDADGKLVDREANYKSKDLDWNTGVEIEFQDDKTKMLQILRYFSVNLGDSRLGKNKPFLAYLGSMGQVVSYMKATSYMPHHNDFEVIKNTIKTASVAVVQDDTGIPYKQWDKTKWDLTLYGKYDKLFKPFTPYQQNDLRAEYAKGAKELPYNIAYGNTQTPACLIVAKKK